ncbi:MAG: hypothetical protein AAGF04_05565, partial [Chlamydiota bacterium]
MKRTLVWLGIIVSQFSILDAATWILNGNGNWSVGANWDSGVAPGTGVDPAANFGSAITAARTVGIDGTFTLNTLSFDNAFSYTLEEVGMNVLTLNGTIDVLQGNHTIDAPINLAGNSSILVNGGASATLVDAISGSSILGKNGTGTLILGGNNTFNLLAFNEGIISISNGNQLGSGEVVFNGAATLVTTQTLERDKTLRMNNGTDAGTISVANGTTFTHSGLLLGSGNLVKTGGGIASFTNSLGFTGPINLQAGTLAAANFGGTETITMQGGTTFQPLDGFSSSRPITLAGNAAILVDGSASATIGGVISGSSILGKNGTGTLILGENNTFDLLAFNAGTISISNGNQLG